MSRNGHDISEADLHAYIDNLLDEGRRHRVEAYLAEHPLEARRVAAYRTLNHQLHEGFDPILDDSLPETVKGLPSGTPVRYLWQAGALALSLILGVLIGLALDSPPVSSPEVLPQALLRPASVAHTVYVPEVRHPVEVGAEQEAHLSQWLSKRLAINLKAPYLGVAGFELMGGRLLPAENGAAAQFMYQDTQGRRLTLYVRSLQEAQDETAFRFNQEGELGMFYWVEGRVGYVLSGAVPRQELLAAAQAAYLELGLY